MSSKTIGSSLTHGVTLTTAISNYNPLYVTGTINTATGDGVHGDNTQPWTLVNSGTIAAAAGNGVKLLGGGSITNGASGASGALISGYLDGVYIYAPGATTGTISNLATITAGANGVGVLLSGAGSITNGAPTVTGAVISSGYIAVEIANVPGTVSNFGTLVGTAGGGAARLDGGGLINGSSSSTAALIDGKSGVAVYNAGGSLTLANYGRIIVDGSGGKPGVKLTTTGPTPNSIINYGTIAANLAAGIYLQKGGIVTNAAGGVISGAAAILVGDAAATVTNAGTIIGSAGTAVAFGTANNRLILKPAAKIQGTVVGGAGSLGSNTLELAAGLATGTIATLNTSFVNFGTLAIDAGADWALGWATNGKAPQSVTNQGTLISVGNLALYLPTGGNVTNGASGLISGTRSGIGIKGTIGATVTNLGTIKGIGSGGQGDGVGIRLAAGAATVGNSGLIQGYGYGLDFNPGAASFTAAGVITNSGTIAAAGTAGIGISFGSATAPSTLTNSGTISGAGGTAIMFAAGDDRLILNPGAVFVGKVDGGGGANTLELALGAGTGTVAGIGASLVNFAVLTVDAGASWQVTGTIGPGVTLTDSGSLFNAGSIGTTATLTAAAYLANSAAGVIDVAGTAIKAAGGTAAAVNLGTVQAASGPGVHLAAGGSVTNGAGSVTSALIAGYDGIVVRGGSGFVANFGTITGSDIFGGGVSLEGGGSLTNLGRIAASGSQSYAVFVVDGSLTNEAGAVITGSGKNGVLLRGTGSIANFGTIAATNATIGVGVSFSGGGDTLINAGAIVGASGAVIFSGSGSNLLVLEHGYQLQGGVIGNASAINTLELAGSAGGGVTVGYNGLALSHFQDVLFGPGGYGMLRVSNTSGTPPVTISGFTLTSDAIDLTAIGTDGAIAALDNVNHRVTVSGSGGSVTLQLDASDATSFQTHSDGASGTDLVLCFCRGTLILTDRGEVLVEDLRVGDRVVTSTGAARPIEWIGFGRDRITRSNKLSRPVIVRRGALADNVPRRDLYLTHGHALYLKGVLIPVENLINHRSILWDERAQVVEYYHIELEAHGAVFAEGALAETYYEAGNRTLFHNTRPGSADGGGKAPFAPVLNGGAAVEQVWQELFARAGGRIDSDTTDDPDLHLMVGGRRLDATHIEGGAYTFAFDTAPDGGLHLCSRSGVPSLLGVTAHDHRRLGVALSRIVISQSGVVTVIDPNAPLLRAGGCHPPEAGYCWADGELALPAYLFAHIKGAFTLAVQIERPRMRYPLPSAAATAA